MTVARKAGDSWSILCLNRAGEVEYEIEGLRYEQLTGLIRGRAQDDLIEGIENPDRRLPVAPLAQILSSALYWLTDGQEGREIADRAATARMVKRVIQALTGEEVGDGSEVQNG